MDSLGLGFYFLAEPMQQLAGRHCNATADGHCCFVVTAGSGSVHFRCVPPDVSARASRAGNVSTPADFLFRLHGSVVAYCSRSYSFEAACMIAEVHGDEDQSELQVCAPNNVSPSWSICCCPAVCCGKNVYVSTMCMGDIAGLKSLTKRRRRSFKVCPSVFCVASDGCCFDTVRALTLRRWWFAARLVQGACSTPRHRNVGAGSLRLERSAAERFPKDTCARFAE